MATIPVKTFALKEGRFSMKRKTYGRDAGLSLRMFITASMLGLLYVIFAVVLAYVLIIALKLQRLERELSELAELARTKQEERKAVAVG